MTNVFLPVALIIAINIVCVNSAFCDEEFSCAGQSIENWIECYGYFSCAFSSSILNAVNAWIDCTSSHACFGSRLINNTNSYGNDQSILCDGLRSCSNVSLIYNHFGDVWCHGELSCANSTIQLNNGILYVYGDRSIMNSRIIGGKRIRVNSRLGAYNTTFINTQNNAFYQFDGTASGKDATIVCGNNHTCSVYCSGDACIGLKVVCDGECNFDIDCDYSVKSGICGGGVSVSDYKDQFMFASLFNASMSITAIDDVNYYNYYSSNDTQIEIEPISIQCNDYQECLTNTMNMIMNDSINTGSSNGKFTYEYSNNGNISFIDSKVSIYCTAYDTCLFTNIKSNIDLDNMYNHNNQMTAINLRCDARTACASIPSIVQVDIDSNKATTTNTTINYNVYAAGIRSLEHSNVFFNYIDTSNNYNDKYVSHLFCTATKSCLSMAVTNCDMVYCTAYGSCISAQMNSITNVWFDAKYSGSNSNVTNVSNNIYCFASYACEYSDISNINGTLYAVGYMALWRATITNVKSLVSIGKDIFSITAVTDVENVTCLGYRACRFSVFRNVGFIRDSERALIGSVIASNRSNGSMHVVVSPEGTQSYDPDNPWNYPPQIICNIQDTCYISCVEGTACDQIQLYCFGTCLVECDEQSGIDCPIAMAGTAYEITTVSNSTYDTDDNDDELKRETKIYNGITQGYITSICIILTCLILAICFQNVFTMYKINRRRGIAIASNSKHTPDIDLCVEESKEKKIVGKHSRLQSDSMSSVDVYEMVSKLALKVITKTYLCNIYFNISLFFMFLCVFLGFVCVLYGFGQITELNVTHYWCDRKDLDTIRKHSVEYDLNEGTQVGCWKTTQFNVDTNSLFDTSIYDTNPDITSSNVSKCIIWLFYSSLFFSTALGFASLYCGDFANICCKYSKPKKNKSDHNGGTDQNGDETDQKQVRAKRSSFHSCCPCM